MSEEKESINFASSNMNSYSSTQNNRDFNVKELKTTHSGWLCINYNVEYLKERMTKLKDESNNLKQKILNIESENSKKKNNFEKIITSLRESNENLKENLELQNININNLSKDNQRLLNELNDIKNINNNLKNDRDILLQQIKELNNIINNNISPKLKTNENDLMSLQDKINELDKKIISLENEKMRLIDDNKNKGKLIKVLTNQNKKLLNEIKMKYNKDLSFIESIEKYEIHNNINSDIYKEMKIKYDNNKLKNNKYYLNHSCDNNEINKEKKYIKVNKRSTINSKRKYKQKLNIFE
jgi:chromosome segregation ATPase